MPVRLLIPLLSSCLILLHGVDFYLTWGLLESGVRSDVYEANPLANSILERHGWSGLAGFKILFGSIGLAAGLILCWKRLTLGLRILALQCLLMAGVVGYSATLISHVPKYDLPPVVDLEQYGRKLQAHFASQQQFEEERTRICQSVLQGTCSMREGLQQLRELIQTHRHSFLADQRRQLPALNQDSQLAAYLYHHCSRLATEPATRASLRRLSRQIARAYPQAPRIHALRTAPGVVPAWTAQ